MSNKNETQPMSHSKAKRLARKQEIAKKKKENVINALLIYGVLGIVVLLLLGLVGTTVYRAATKISPTDDYSNQLSDNGFIQGVNAASKLTLCDYASIEVPADEIAYTDEEFETEKTTQLNAHQELSTDTSVVAAADSKVNIDYTGSIDGEEFEGGSATEYDLTLGSQSFIDDFEDQLVGSKPGDQVTVNVTFPEDYASADLAGKDAVFEVTVNGVYVTPAFDDAFVKEYLSDYADTVEGYHLYQKETNETERKLAWIDQYLQDNTQVKSYPKAYLKQVASLSMYQDQQSYEFMNQFYESSYGQKMYNSFNDYTQLSDDQYQAQLKANAELTAKADLIYQAILEQEGVSLSEDEVKANEGEGYDTNLETYGAGFLAKKYIKDKALEIVAEKATVK